ncbi:MAG: alkaline phosphatase [Bacteroidales bacterium]|nr:alkaline phosphatase [Bacteroidales bacterium]
MKKICYLMIVLCCISVVDLDAAKKKAKHVIMIGIDGWAAEGLRQADPEDIPNIKDLMDHGSWTLAKRSVMPSASAINWASMFNGLPTEMHGFDKWNSTKGTIPSTADNGRGIPPTIYTIIREQRPEAETGIIYDWNGVGAVCDKEAASYEYFIKTYKGTEVIVSVEEYTKLGVEYIKEKKPFFFTFYYGLLDNTGHNYGWYSPEYMAVQKSLDKGIGMLIQALKDAGIYEDSVIIVSADHGGKGKGHGKFTLEELETPFIVFGKKIKQGYEISLPMMQYDTPAIIADILGINIPEGWRGRAFKEIYK